VDPTAIAIGSVVTSLAWSRNVALPSFTAAKYGTRSSRNHTSPRRCSVIIGGAMPVRQSNTGSPWSVHVRLPT
jgi:hypothetical protein